MKRYNLKKILVVFAVALAVFFAGLAVSNKQVALAEGNNQDYAILKPPAGENGISYLLRMAIRILTGLVAVLAVVSIVYAGVQYASAGDSPEKVKAAKDRITQTVIGVLLYIFMFAILEFLIPGGVLGIRSGTPGDDSTSAEQEVGA